MLTNDETEYLVAAATAGCDHLMSEQVEQIEDGIRSHVIRQPHLVVSLALLSVLRRKHERAIALYRLMLDLMPDQWRLRALLARIHYDLGEPQWKVEIGRVLRHVHDPHCLSTVRSLLPDVREEVLLALAANASPTGRGATPGATPAAARVPWAS
ncbi:MAG: hypothetical protein ACK5XM_01900 [Betaproteobacteria bacterium]